MYAYIDGDDIGLKIENSFMNNDEKRLMNINNSVKDVVNEISLYLVNSGYEIIFSGADGIICKREEMDAKELLDYVRGRDNKLTFSIGIGLSLRDSYLALRYAKSNGKNIAAIFNKNFKLIV